MAEREDPNRMVKVIGPVYRDSQGNVKGTYKERDMPWKSATSEHVRALGVTIVNEIAEGFTADPRKSAGQAEAERLRAELEATKAKLAELEKATKKEPKVKADAGN